MQEAEGRLFGFGQGAQVSAHGFEQAEGADDVGLNEVFGAVNGAVHMAFGGKVQHGAGAVLGQQAIHQVAIAQVAMHKGVAGVALQPGEIFQVARIGQFVEVDDGLIGLGAPVEHEVGANKTGAAGKENHKTPNTNIFCESFMSKSY